MSLNTILKDEQEELDKLDAICNVCKTGIKAHLLQSNKRVIARIVEEIDGMLENKFEIREIGWTAETEKWRKWGEELINEHKQEILSDLKASLEESLKGEDNV